MTAGTSGWRLRLGRALVALTGVPAGKPPAGLHWPERSVTCRARLLGTHTRRAAMRWDSLGRTVQGLAAIAVRERTTRDELRS